MAQTVQLDSKCKHSVGYKYVFFKLLIFFPACLPKLNVVHYVIKIEIIRTEGKLYNSRFIFCFSEPPIIALMFVVSL